MLKQVLLASAALVVLGSPVKAADMVAPTIPDEPMPFEWTGFYVGLQGGHAWGKNDATAEAGGGGGGGGGGSGGGGANLFARSSDPVTLSSGTGTIGVGGFVGGLHTGYNWQMDKLVLGVEGDIEYADIDSVTDVLDDTGNKVGEDEQEIDWLGSLRLRAGYAADRTLFYATGGLAVGRVELTLNDLDGAVASNRETNWGWTLGGGIEHAFTDALSARVEYRYTDLGSIKAEGADGDIGEADTAFHAIRAGLSWHF